jgi:IS4 transposase
MDKAFNDYQLFAAWTEKGIYFVTRLKENADYRVVRSLPVPQNRNIVSDKIIRFTGPSAGSKCPCQLRRIVVWDEKHQREIILLTNHLEFGPTTIAAIYKDRWQIELFFKALKQNLKVKSFVGTSENAIHIQIWTALIALLILRWLHHQAKEGWAFANCVYLFRMNLFTYRDLRQWLQSPFTTEPIVPMPEQLNLPIGYLGQLPQHPTKATST